jgi:hypothetical protein
MFESPSSPLLKRLSWLTHGPRRAEPFAALRIGTAAVLLAKFLAEAVSLQALYGDRGLMPWAISDLRYGDLVPRLSLITPLLADRIAPPVILWGAAALYTTALLLLLAGWRARPAAFVALVLHLIFSASGALSGYGVDLFAQAALFYVALGPRITLWSVDARGAAVTVSAADRVLLRLLQAHLAIVYLSAGLAKAAGAQWWNGEAIWRSVMQPQFRQFDFSWLAAVPWIPVLVGWSTMAIEVGYCVLIWPRRSRVGWLALTVSLHLAIAVMLGLWFFAAIMIVANVAAFGWSAPAEAAWDGEVGGVMVGPSGLEPLTPTVSR